MKANVAIIGAGRWGTTLAIALSRLGHQVRLGTLQEECEELRHTRRSRTLSDYEIPENVTIDYSQEVVLGDSHFVIFAVPGEYLRSAWQQWHRAIPNGNILINAVKTLDEDGGHLVLPSDILTPDCPFTHFACAAFPDDVLAGMPVMGTIFSKEKLAAEEVQQLFAGTSIRPYTRPDNDIIGGQIGSAVKNVIAIGCGMAVGLGYRAMTQSSVVCRSMNEIERFAVRFGARRGTFVPQGAIMADLIGTCFSPDSRNFSYGRWFTDPDSFAPVIGVVEGLRTVNILARLLGQEFSKLMPISAAILR